MAAEPISVPDQDAIFKQLEEYEWDKDKQYQGGLSAILGPSPSPSQVYDLTLRAQCFYMSRKNGVAIDFDAYKAYLSSQSANSASIITETDPLSNSKSISSVSPIETNFSAIQLQDEDPSTSSIINTPSAIAAETPQEQEPLSSVDSTSNRVEPPSTTYSSTYEIPFPAGPGSDRPRLPALSSQDLIGASQSISQLPPVHTTYSPPNDPSTAPYPASFAEIVALIQSGEPVPGIKQIPQTVAWGQGGKPTLRARRKPWEMHLTEEEVQPGYVKVFGDRRDEWIRQEFPEGEEEEAKKQGDGGETGEATGDEEPGWKKLKSIPEVVPSWQTAMMK